jgi:hypothetical protein
MHKFLIYLSIYFFLMYLGVRCLSRQVLLNRIAEFTLNTFVLTFLYLYVCFAC